jgi:small ligand-binding sensory domain FIST
MKTQDLAKELGNPSDFGLLFSCLGRGPYLYEGVDRDLKVITQSFPHMPLLGFYGNGEIACINGSNQLLPYSAVLSLFSTQ